jgi:hypothetical protein
MSGEREHQPGPAQARVFRAALEAGRALRSAYTEPYEVDEDGAASFWFWPARRDFHQEPVDHIVYKSIKNPTEADTAIYLEGNLESDQSPFVHEGDLAIQEGYYRRSRFGLNLLSTEYEVVLHPEHPPFLVLGDILREHDNAKIPWGDTYLRSFPDEPDEQHTLVEAACRDVLSFCLEVAEQPEAFLDVGKTNEWRALRDEV